jgi:hypothetical protein
MAIGEHPSGAIGLEPSGTRLKIAVALTFVALTFVVTYPQVRVLTTSVPYHSDPYFSMWRLGWVAHALRTNPGGLFDANIFYPARDTLAYSDAMLLPGVLLAPFFWAGVPAAAVYNAALFTALALSGYAVFTLTRRLTGSAGAGLAAGVIYAFAPYRFTHYAHLELQLVFWIPIALCLWHRLTANGRVRDGILLGLTVAAQLLSCIYAGIFSIAYFTVFVPALLVSSGVAQARRLLVAALIAALLTVLIVAPYAAVYMRAERSVGARSADTIGIYSASLRNYLSAPAINRIYGWTAVTDPIGADEMNLFPGVIAAALALLGVLAGQGRVRFAYLIGLAFAFEMSRGASSPAYRWLFEHVHALRALRSPARMNILVTLSLAVLSGYGAGYVLARIRHRAWRHLTVASLVALLTAEYASAPRLVPVPPTSRVDKLLSTLRAAVIVEVPVTSRRGIWGSLDWLYMYQGMEHFQRMLNGYSGHAPAALYEMRDTMASFPDDRSMAFLRERRVDYVVVRAGLFEPEERAALLEAIGRRRDLSLKAMWLEGPQGAEGIYAVEKSLPR